MVVIGGLGLCQKKQAILNTLPPTVSRHSTGLFEGDNNESIFAVRGQVIRTWCSR